MFANVVFEYKTELLDRSDGCNDEQWIDWILGHSSLSQIILLPVVVIRL